MYTRVKAKCGACSLHFIVCTLRPERHSAASLYCPECGQHDGEFLVWSEVVDRFIFRDVPGQAEPVPAGETAKPMPAISLPDPTSQPRPWWRFWG